MARLLVEPRGAFGAYISSELVAVAFATVWGSVGLFGPISVKPGHWNIGVGRKLLQQSVRYFHENSVSDMVLCTFPDSVKHVSFYQKFGFYPGHLIAMVSRLVPDGPAFPELELYSVPSLNRSRRVLAECREITESIYAGLDLSREIEVAEKLSIGETVLVRRDSRLEAFAICHYGPGSETETDVLYIKFAAVRSLSDTAAGPARGPASAPAPAPAPAYRGKARDDSHPDSTRDRNEIFRTLLEKCSILAQRKNANMIFFGVNTARHEAYKVVLEEGFKLDSLSIAMQSTNRSLYNHPHVFVIDDWR
jgi:hypothetical protein